MSQDYRQSRGAAQPPATRQGIPQHDPSGAVAVVACPVGAAIGSAPRRLRQWERGHGMR